MPHCQCEGIEQCFDSQRATSELDEYRKHGLSKNTRLLVEALQTQGIAGLTLLDIGGGVGGISHDAGMPDAASERFHSLGHL